MYRKTTPFETCMMRYIIEHWIFYVFHFCYVYLSVCKSVNEVDMKRWPLQFKRAKVKFKIQE